MSALIGAGEAAHILGVTKPTLYAYVSRGLVERRVAVDGRTSLYDREAVERLSQRSKRRPADRPSIDVKISTAITQLHDDSPTYRGIRVLDLAAERTFEDVTELLLTGELPAEPAALTVDRALLARVRRVIDECAETTPLARLTIAATVLGDEPGADAASTARTLIGLAPSVLGGPRDGDIATRLANAWERIPSNELVDAISIALVLLADHELATSTLAVRVAASVRTAPAAAAATGLHVVAGPLHGAASEAAALLFEQAHTTGARATIRARLDAGRRLPGFGHTVYRNGDPRFPPLLEAVRALPVTERHDVVEDVISEAGRAIGHLPNVDLALGALYFVGRLPFDAPLFAIARIAGWAAHYEEELGERPVRFRGLARPR